LPSLFPLPNQPGVVQYQIVSRSAEQRQFQPPVEPRRGAGTGSLNRSASSSRMARRSSCSVSTHRAGAHQHGRNLDPHPRRASSATCSFAFAQRQPGAAFSLMATTGRRLGILGTSSDPAQLRPKHVYKLRR
jgi:hypothetical protein